MSIKYPVKDVVLPKDIKNAENGKLPASVMKKIDIGGQLHHLAADAFNAMTKAAKADGIHFKHVGDYRPYDAQLSLFKQRYVKGDSGDPRKITRTFEGEKWMLKAGMAPAGSPGTSNHGWGIAIDVALEVGGKVVAITSDPDGKGGFKDGVEWLMANADKFGFSWEIKEGAQAEAWHIRYYPGDNVPAAVSGTAPAPTAPAPAAPAAPAPTAKATTYPGTTITDGATGDVVKAIQTKLGVAVTGTFDAATSKAVKAFKTKNGMQQDSIVGPKVWAKLFGA
jgi:LAS superfamily LD-carboxypeptidase LdcB